MEPPTQTARRYVEIAKHVTTQDPLVESLDGLETLMLQALYQCHVGNMDEGCQVFRRALAIANSMKLPKLRGYEELRARSLWFRLLYADCFHSLAKGIPSTAISPELEDECFLQADQPTERLERTHVSIARQITFRNAQTQLCKHSQTCRDNLCASAYEETQKIDQRLKLAARSLPIRWWALPNASLSVDAEARDITARLITQMHQSYLVLLLHQPYVIRALHLGRLSVDADFNVDHAYSSLAAVSAGREILLRFQTLLQFRHIPSSFKGLEHKAFMSSVIMLLVYINAQRQGTTNVLEHQRLHDLNLIDQAANKVEQMQDSTGPTSLDSSVGILKKLLKVESETSNGVNYDIWSEWCADFGAYCEPEIEHEELSLSTAYFGVIHVRHCGMQGK